jgi:hypothetical protein
MSQVSAYAELIIRLGLTVCKYDYLSLESSGFADITSDFLMSKD